MSMRGNALYNIADHPTPKIDEKEVAYTLESRDYKCPQVVAYRGDAITSPVNASNPQPGDPCHTLTDDSRNYVVKKTVYDWHRQDTRMTELKDVCTTAAAGWGGGGNNMPYVMEEESMDAVVRRLTPLECERLQGYPDGWTDIGEWVDSKGKTHKDADSPRYKALGNSIALPFWEWMAKRIAAQYERPITMASLFDGIGGFPLVFQRAGAKPVWASEIEEFPIAVTKIHFPEKDNE